MALPLNIDDLIHQRKVEGARIEYKKDWNPEKVLHSVCAFANDIDNWGGGYIILGVEEKNGMPVLPPNGICKESVDAVNKELLNVCNLIEGRYVPVVSHEVYDGADILATSSRLSAPSTNGSAMWKLCQDGSTRKKAFCLRPTLSRPWRMPG